jgi:RND family efflux transporter MFP subunit
VVIVGGVIGAVRLIETAPKAQRRPPTRQATLVQVEPAERIDTNAQVQAMGTVVPSKEVVLQPRVSGEIVELSPSLVPGGRFEAGEVMLRIDRSDYELAVERMKGQLANAQYELKLERGHQEIAEREWNLLGMQDEASEEDLELALRKPQLVKAEAALKSAEAALKEAELDLERTTIRAPFNCMVIEENIDLGAQVTVQTQLATLVGTDEYWVQASLPVDQLRWISFPGAENKCGSPVIIHQELGAGVQGEWAGQVVRLMGNLEPQGRMARVLISVPEPLDPSETDGTSLPLLIEAYVKATIEGHPVSNIISLPRNVLREDRYVWVMNEQDQLDIREIDILRRNRDRLLVSAGIEEGERVVVSDLPAPVAGMALAIRGEEPEMVESATTESPEVPEERGLSLRTENGGRPREQ